ncbi:MAG TPA: hypothetical protein VK327_10850, partial [Candidatus Paceibacterota bacterium]|nr:hypothetical protein [Candidatus Paceibacterota bacterium]
GYSTLGYVDVSSTLGFLQQPNHQADIWYIGIYTPAAPLGNFVLNGIDLVGPQIGFDGVGAATNIVNQPVSKLQFFRIDVPTNTFGWDLRITNVTSGDPRLVICRDRLPYDLGTHDLNGYGWSPQYSLTWPSGYQIGTGYDWTGEYYDPNGTNQYGHVFEVGMGNPLQAGTYYIGVVNSTGPGYQNPMSYSLVSRGIGTNVSIPITDLAFTNGTVSNPGLRAREAAYYRIVVPTNVPSWELKLTADAGESLLILEKDYLPNVWAGGSSPIYPYGGRKMQKLGNERYALLPTNGQTNIAAGTYYLAVVSEGVNPNTSYAYIGTGSSAYTLTSLGVLTITNLGTLDATGVTDILHTNSCEGGQIKAFRFTVPPGTLAMEVHLDDRVGNPLMTFRPDNQLPNPTDSYGCDGGQSYTWYNSGLVNIANPTPTNYTLIVQAANYSGGYSNASYTIRVHALTSQPIGFDGASLTTVGQPSGLWKYYTITVPTNAFGWDIRITNVLSGDPRLVIRRDLAPDSLGTHDVNGYGWSPQYASSWPSGYQIAAGYDWTGEYYDPNGTNRYGHVFEVGMGNPLSPGNYIIGVINSSGPGYQNPMSYTLVSRGIGTNLSIPINDLTFTNGAVSNPNLIPREVAYYRVVVPTNMPSWKLKLNADAGETLLMLQKDALPSVAAGGTSPIYLYGGRKVQKTGNEQYVLLPISGQSNIVAGTYYLAVAGEGMNPHSVYIGTNTSAFTLTSFGALTISNLGPVDFTGVTDIIVTNSNEGGEIKAYQFSVPPGTLSLEVRLESLAGYPLMTFRTGDQIPNPPDGYGSDGGQGYTWYGSGLINIANPIATNYTMIVQAAPYSGIYSNATYRLRFHALGPQPVGFDGGTGVITGQPSGTWQYFTITVPPNAFGWDLRITNVLSGDPRLVVRRDFSPDSLGTHDANGYGWTPQYSSSWPSGYQIAAGYDWTGEYRDPNGTNRYGHVLALGMGNPLSPGNYIVGVLNSSGPGYQNPMSYTLVSRGIGAGFSIPINDLAFTNGSATNLSLLAREAAYYRVVVPTNVPNWKLRLTTVSGESLLALQKDALPGVMAANSTPTLLYGGRKLQKAGNEQYLLLPNSGGSNIIAGTYYLLVASEGVNPNTSTATIGTNSSSYVLNSYGTVTKTNLGTVGVADLYGTNVLQGGEALLYNFTIPPATAAVEVRLDNRAGNPYMTMGTGPFAINPYDNYGNDGGVSASWSSPTLLTFPNPTATNYSLTVQAANQSGYPDANCIVHVRRMPTPTLNFSANLNTNGFTNVVSATLSDNQRAFYQVVVPATNNGHAVIGWKLDLEQTSGTPSVRVRQNLLPDDNYYGGTSPWATGEGIIVPPYLTPGTWYVEVKGSGATSFTLTSSDLTTERPAWSMPVEGNLVTTPGLPASGPLFGDTGVDTNGVPLPGDQGIDLAQGNFHFYSVTVPPGNIGVMRTRLDAISGDPNLYIRVGSPPTLTHNASGLGGTLYERSLTANIGSEYGNWVPLAGRYEAYLTPGTWYFAVKASGNSNVRYRLRMFTGIVNDLSLNNGSYTGQNLGII